MRLFHQGYGGVAGYGAKKLRSKKQGLGSKTCKGIYLYFFYKVNHIYMQIYYY